MRYSLSNTPFNALLSLSHVLVSISKFSISITFQILMDSEDFEYEQDGNRIKFTFPETYNLWRGFSRNVAIQLEEGTIIRLSPQAGAEYSAYPTLLVLILLEAGVPPPLFSIPVQHTFHLQAGYNLIVGPRHPTAGFAPWHLLVAAFREPPPPLQILFPPPPLSPPPIEPRVNSPWSSNRADGDASPLSNSAASASADIELKSEPALSESLVEEAASGSTPWSPDDDFNDVKPSIEMLESSRC